MTSIRRTASLLVVLAMLMTMTAIPAFAVASAAATIASGKNLLAGQSGQVTVKITNSASGGVAAGVGKGTSIDAFVIEVPLDLVDVNSVTLPEGWDGGYDDEIGFVFATAKEGKKLAPTDALDVVFNVKADATADDRTGSFVTSVSDNGGLTLSSAGTPAVTSRILEVTNTVLVKPTPHSNLDLKQVTAGQNNATYKVTVRNHGTAARSVSADMVRFSGSSTVTSTPTAKTIPAATTDTITVPVTFGSAGTLTMDAKATTTSSAAEGLRLEQVAVQAAFVANVVAGSIEPKAVAPNAVATLSYRINKTAGAQPVTANANLKFGGTSGLDVTKPQTFDAANGEKNVTFTNITTPNLVNGDYATSSTIVGNDANGAAVNLSLNPGTITIDNLLPIVNITLAPGASDVPGAVQATTNGRTITFSGTIGLNQGTGLCTSCTVTGAVLVASPSNTALEITNLTNTNGTLSGSQSFTFPAGTTSTFARVTVERSNKAAASGTSNIVPVDLIRPALAGPGLTLREAANDVILINLADDGIFLDAEISRATDWSVDDNSVIDVIGLPNENGATSVKLVLRSRLGDNDTPVVSYTAPPLTSTRMHDRVSLTVADQVINTKDGIIPTAPVLDTVDGFGLQPDAFHTNNSTPKVKLSALVPGNTLELFYDINNNGAEAGERVFVGQVATATQEVDLTTLGSVGRTGTLIARMKDGAGNIGVLDAETLVLDFATAKIIKYTVSGNQVTIEFDEPVARGRDAAFDWTVNATTGSTTANRTVSQVQIVGGDLTKRVLTVSSSSWDGSGTVNSVRYKFRGAAADRYQDRATNVFADVNYTN